MASQNQKAIFAGGCFWCTEALFGRLKGVISARPGYAGGAVKNPTYEQVSSGGSGHAEAVEIEFDPEQISYEDLLTVFFFTHDPTTLNRQGNDVGPQYRSVIFFVSDFQKRAAENFVARLVGEKAYDKPIVTTIEPSKIFYHAEDYHKNYYEDHKDEKYCELIITPKIEKLKTHLLSLLR